jgi:2-methylisocitrate lyase-like PEP mutase family enzyme
MIPCSVPQPHHEPANRLHSRHRRRTFPRGTRRQQAVPIVGTINPYCAMMAERVGHKAIDLAGGGLAT